MFSLPRISLPSFLRPGSGTHPTVNLPSVEVHDIETAAGKRPRTLKHLIKANHANYSIIYHNLRFHNHTPHILGSAYFLGGTAEHLNEIYEKEAEELEPWHDAPGEITKDDWREFLGKREYQRAFIDFFEDQLVSKKYDLKDLLDEFLLGGKEPLINGLISGLAHPLIHLGYAYELQSRSVAIEALALGSCFYSSLHKYIDDPKYTKPSPHRATENETNLLEMLEKVREDKRFDGLYDHRSGDISKVLEEREDAFLEYWNAWEIVNPNDQFHAAQTTAAEILLGTPTSGNGAKFDFFFVHVLTSSHAIRILLPLIPAKFHVGLLRQWWFFALAVYIAQTRPPIDSSRPVDAYDSKGRDWKHVVHKALNGPHANDAHYVKALRAMKVADETWRTPGDESSYWLNGAVKFADEFEGWGGFGTAGDGDKLGYPEQQ
ncbi:Nn.00g056890.m01.CDS01 [Neocucurbitaria sp. VM-36]